MNDILVNEFSSKPSHVFSLESFCGLGLLFLCLTIRKPLPQKVFAWDTDCSGASVNRTSNSQAAFTGEGAEEMECCCQSKQNKNAPVPEITCSLLRARQIFGSKIMGGDEE